MNNRFAVSQVPGGILLQLLDGQQIVAPHDALQWALAIITMTAFASGKPMSLAEARRLDDAVERLRVETER